ncbi:hypothetical protein [Metaplanococcus flavidus]|uniref:Uncharacterized protein n=1 Tax=Metaplanococcus flavidus TaxID=569883 RepID=A0ABW3LE36_9BACL
MDLHYYVLSFCFFSKPISYVAPEIDGDAKLFTHEDINSSLNLSDTLHFNRGESNFFTQRGPATYAFWAHSFYLTKEEADLLNDDVEHLLEVLFEKLKQYLIENDVSKEKIEALKQTYNGRCEVILSHPNTLIRMFTLRQNPLNTLVDFGLNFHHWPLSIEQLDQLK